MIIMLFNPINSKFWAKTGQFHFGAKQISKKMHFLLKLYQSNCTLMNVQILGTDQNSEKKVSENKFDWVPKSSNFYAMLLKESPPLQT